MKIGDGVETFIINTHTHTYLSYVIEREPGQKDVSKELGHAKHTVHNPVDEPFCVIVFVDAFNGFDSANRF